MPSITHWNRLEPRPRAPSIAGPLQARIRDPLWLLTRQWQFGEFGGEDAGSPAFARVAGRSVPLSGWRSADGPIAALPPQIPFEPLAQREAFAADLSVQVELAQTFETLLGAEPGVTGLQRQAVLAELRAKLPLAPPPADDLDARGFFLVSAGRSFDGAAVYRAGLAQPPGTPAGVVLDPAVVPAFRHAQATLVAWVGEVFGAIGPADADAWQPERLDYAASLIAVVDEKPVELQARTAPDGAFEWHAFSQLPPGEPPAGTGAAPPRPQPWSIIPTHVRFRGMPNARWWDFETGTTDFGDLRPDRRDLARLVVMDFMLVHGNDWFVIPYDVPVGCLARIDALVVRDVFGGDTVVDRADQRPAGARWSQFSISAEGTAAGIADYLLVPPSVAGLTQTSLPREEVLFLRDELANMAWGIELTVEGAAGTPRAGHERSLALAAPPAVEPPMPTYQIQTDVPAHWIPFLPVTLDAAAGRYALERAGMPNPAGPGLIRPAGRVLEPSALAGQPYQLHEEEVTRLGTRVIRVVCRARWSDGSTHLWISRQRTAGAGEASSGLLFDTARGT